jgi:hypothetical protein
MQIPRLLVSRLVDWIVTPSAVKWKVKFESIFLDHQSNEYYANTKQESHNSALKEILRERCPFPREHP